MQLNKPRRPHTHVLCTVLNNGLKCVPKNVFNFQMNIRLICISIVSHTHTFFLFFLLFSARTEESQSTDDHLSAGIVAKLHVESSFELGHLVAYVATGRKEFISGQPLIFSCLTHISYIRFSNVGQSHEYHNSELHDRNGWKSRIIS